LTPELVEMRKKMEVTSPGAKPPRKMHPIGITCSTCEAFICWKRLFFTGVECSCNATFASLCRDISNQYKPVTYLIFKNDKCHYVGSTINLYQRLQSHKYKFDGHLKGLSKLNQCSLHEIGWSIRVSLILGEVDCYKIMKPLDNKVMPSGDNANITRVRYGGQWHANDGGTASYFDFTKVETIKRQRWFDTEYNHCHRDHYYYPQIGILFGEKRTDYPYQPYTSENRCYKGGYCNCSRKCTVHYRGLKRIGVVKAYPDFIEIMQAKDCVARGP
jgi:hypothetical protein